MQFLASIGIALAQVVYGACKFVLPRRRKVLMLSRQSDKPSRDFRMLAEQIHAVDPTAEVVIRCRRYVHGLSGKLGYVGEVLGQIRHLADASVCVLDGYSIPVSVLSHRDELTVIQMWHALGAIKKFGWQAVDLPGGRSSAIAKAMRMHRNYDFALCGGPASVPHFAQAFGIESARVLPLGLPRVDFLLEHAEDTVDTSDSVHLRELAELYPRLKQRDKLVVLYAPTFRSGVETECTPVVSAFADERYTLVLKPHDRECAEFHAENVVVAAGIDIARLLPIVDVVITDYSAVAFEALVLKKPVYFYVYDIDDYERRHGLNIHPLRDLPALSSRDIFEIAEKIGSNDYDSEAAARFAESYVPLEGGCTEGIAELVVSALDGEAAR